MSPQRNDSNLDFESSLESHDPCNSCASIELRSPLSSERVLGYVLWAVLVVVVFGVGTSS